MKENEHRMPNSEAEGKWNVLRVIGDDKKGDKLEVQDKDAHCSEDEVTPPVYPVIDVNFNSIQEQQDIQVLNFMLKLTLNVFSFFSGKW